MLKDMKRILQSLAGGIFIPIFYLAAMFLVVAVVRVVTGNADGNSWWFWLLGLPLEWSGHIYNRLFPPEYEKVFGELRGQVIWTNIITNFIVYSLLTYGFLRWRSKRKSLA
jgi:hypothetical protein